MLGDDSKTRGTDVVYFLCFDACLERAGGYSRGEVRLLLMSARICGCCIYLFFRSFY